MTRLIDVLTEFEIKQLNAFMAIDLNKDLRDLKVRDLNKIWQHIHLRNCDGIVPRGNFISFAWEELVNRSIEKGLTIF